MKRTEYFVSEEALNEYYPNGVPSGVLAIVQPDAETPAILYTSSNNSPVGGGSSEGQGGVVVDMPEYYWCPDPDNAPTTYYPFEAMVDEDTDELYFSYTLGDVNAESAGALIANINMEGFSWNGFLYFDAFTAEGEVGDGYQESRPIQLVRGSGEAGPDASGGISLDGVTLANAELQIRIDEFECPVLIITGVVATPESNNTYYLSVSAADDYEMEEVGDGVYKYVYDVGQASEQETYTIKVVDGENETVYGNQTSDVTLADYTSSENRLELEETEAPITLPTSGVFTIYLDTTDMTMWCEQYG